MPKEVISLHVGQAGIQMGNAIWELYTAEHNICADGSKRVLPNDEIDIGVTSFFSESQSGKMCPRSIFVDLEPTVVDEIRTGAYRSLFHTDYMISGEEDAANNFARGFFSLGKLQAEDTMDSFRRIIESCESARSIMIYRSQGGGTGSGMTACLFDYLVDYAKINKAEVPIYPSPSLSSAMTEPYNTVLSEHFCMDDLDISFMLDNEALYNIAFYNLNIQTPSFNHINRLIAQACCSLSAPSRFPNILFNDIHSLMTNLVPFPRIHFPMINFGPIWSMDKYNHDTPSVETITRCVYDPKNQMLKCNPLNHKYMSCAFIYRGDIAPAQVYKVLGKMKSDRILKFVEWAPTGFKVGITYQPPSTIPNSCIAPTTRQITMLTNNGAIGEVIERFVHRFNILYSKRSFVHWYVGEGLEECEFNESLYNLSAIVRDYEEASMDLDDRPDDETETESQTPTQTTSQTPTQTQTGTQSPSTGQTEETDSRTPSGSQSRTGTGSHTPSQSRTPSSRSNQRSSGRSSTTHGTSQQSSTRARQEEENSQSGSRRSQESSASKRSQKDESSASKRSQKDESSASKRSQKDESSASKRSQKDESSASKLSQKEESSASKRSPKDASIASKQSGSRSRSRSRSNQGSRQGSESKSAASVPSAASGGKASPRDESAAEVMAGTPEANVNEGSENAEPSI